MKLNLCKIAWALGVVMLCLPVLPLQAEMRSTKLFLLPQPITKTITGTVVDANNEPLVGAVVVVTGTSNGTTTDINGKFKLDIPVSSPSITVTSIGYKDQQIKIEGKTSFQIVMEEEQTSLDEVVVVGYGTLKKKEMTSAISHVSEKDFAKISSLDAGMLLQGKVAGLSVVNTGVGDPNQQASLQIRGVSSRSAGLSPLIVIDGIPEGNLTNINPADIESIDVLKDGAASAIYGTRASNGVILVNLKKGTRDGQIHTSYNFSYTISAPKREIDLLTANEFREYIAVNNSVLDKGANTDWFEEATHLGLAQKHTLTLSGGNVKTNYRGTVDYRDARGIDLRSDRKEYGARLNVNHTTAGGLLTFTANVSPRYIKRNKADWGWFSTLLSNNPTMPVKDANGNYTDFFGYQGGNIIEDMNLVSNGTEIKLLAWDGTVQLNVLPLLMPKRDDMSLTARLTFAEQHVDKFDYYYSPSTTNANKRANYAGQASRTYGNNIARNLDFVINYLWDIKNTHHIRAMLGYSYGYGMNQGLEGSNKDFQSDALMYNNLGGGEWNAAEKGRTGVSTYKNDHKLIGFFGRINYNYADRYMASFSIRHEGSSRFGFNKKWGNFPAMSIGWRISKEKWFQGIPWLTDLKLRYDFGVTGNQNFDNYQSLATYRAFGQYTYENVLYHVWGPSKNVNPNLRWEKGYNQNLGVDFSLLKDRVSGSINYYHKKQVDLLGTYDVPVPPNLFGTIFANVGTLKNTGWEFDLRVDAIQSKSFTWSFNANAYTNNNEFESFSSDVYKGQDYYDTCTMANPGNPGPLQRIEVGKRIGNYFTYRYAGVADDGNWLIYDKDNNVIPIADGTDDDKSVTGNGLPKLNAALTNNFTWKNLDASISMRGAFGFELFDVHDFYYGLQTRQGNLSSNAFRRNAKITKGSNVISDYFIHSGDYWKIESISLGYTFNIRHKFVNKVRVYGTANNLYTFTHFPGVDPSTYQVNGLTPGTFGGSASYYPSTFQFIFGMQVDF